MSARKMYSPAWWLPGGHLQTLWAKFAHPRAALELDVSYIKTPDGDEMEIRSTGHRPGAPQLLLLHGLEGTPRSHYVASTLAAFHEAEWGAHFLSLRSCGTRMNRTKRFYHSGDTVDLDTAIRWLVDRYPSEQICIVGVSLGGNLLLKFLGERGEATPKNLTAAAAISVPFDLGRSARRVNSGFSRVYQQFFLRSLKRKVHEKRAAFPDLPDAETLRHVRNLADFDDLVTAPLHGFENASDYYRKSSSLGYLSGIRIPTLLLNAVDDPFLPPETLALAEGKARQNPFLHVEFLPRGGHVGFVSGSPWRAHYYAEDRVLEFFQAAVASNRRQHEGE